MTATDRHLLTLGITQAVRSPAPRATGRETTGRWEEMRRNVADVGGAQRHGEPNCPAVGRGVPEHPRDVLEGRAYMSERGLFFSLAFFVFLDTRIPISTGLSCVMNNGHPPLELQGHQREPPRVSDSEGG